MRKVQCRWASALFSIALLVGTAGAQPSPPAGTGSITGVVIDPSGAVIAGAEILVTSESSGKTCRTKTDSSGLYECSGIPAGSYRLQVASRGFQTQTKTSISVSSSSVTRLEIKLPAGTGSGDWSGPTAVPVQVEDITAENVAKMPVLSGSIAGTVVDHRKAPVPGVRVAAVDSDGNTFETATDPSGVYRLLELNPGTYSVRFEGNGFRPQTRHRVSVAVAQETQIDVRLKSRR